MHSFAFTSVLLGLPSFQQSASLLANHRPVCSPATKKHATLQPVMRFRDDAVDDEYPLNKPSNFPLPMDKPATTLGDDVASATSPEYEIGAEKIGTDSLTNLRAFIKVSGSLRPRDEIVYWWHGDIYGMVEEEKVRHLSSCEAYNIGRMVRIDGGWCLLTREVLIYRDPRTRRILHGAWRNPYTNKDVAVTHVWNDPVNNDFVLNHPRRGRFNVPSWIMGDDLTLQSEINLTYPFSIPASKFPSNSRSDTYHATECYNFFTSVKDMESDRPYVQKSMISWTRIGQWLPWMEMGDRQGRLMYHCLGKRLENGYTDLPTGEQSMRGFEEATYPQFCKAPESFYLPNDTSWTYYRRLLDSKAMAVSEESTPIFPEISVR